MTIAEGGLHAITLHAHDMHAQIQVGMPCEAESAQCWGHCCRNDFVGWVGRWINNAEGRLDDQDWPARIHSLLMRVRMATKLLVEGDAMRMQPEPKGNWRDRVQRAASRCSDEYSQLISLTLWVRIGGARGRSVAAECMKMEARRVTQYLRRRIWEAGTRWLESRAALRARGIEPCGFWVGLNVFQYYEAER